MHVAPGIEEYDWGNQPVELGIDGHIQGRNASLALQLCQIWLRDHDKSKLNTIYDRNSL